MVKMVSLSDNAYGSLKAIKNKDESFSDVIIKLIERPKRDIMELAGAWEDLPEMDSIFRNIAVKRKSYKGRTRVEL